MTATARFSHALGDIDIQLSAADCTSHITASTLTSDDEQIV